jgi:hypothetical protein
MNDEMRMRQLYDGFDASMTDVDCGKMCAPHNPSGKPFCCDICHAVPAVYREEWDFLRPRTELWQEYRGDECTEKTVDPATLLANTPEHMLLLACQGPAHCQRDFRAVSCRQFPFFPYISVDYRFIGLAYEWEFEETCWVISNLGRVTDVYRREFVATYDALFEQYPQDFDSYAILSDQMRAHFIEQRRRIPLLHRNGGYYLVSPASGRRRRVKVENLPKFGVYK